MVSYLLLLLLLLFLLKRCSSCRCCSLSLELVVGSFLLCRELLVIVVLLVLLVLKVPMVIPDAPVNLVSWVQE